MAEHIKLILSRVSGVDLTEDDLDEQLIVALRQVAGNMFEFPERVLDCQPKRIADQPEQSRRLGNGGEVLSEDRQRISYQNPKNSPTRARKFSRTDSKFLFVSGVLLSLIFPICFLGWGQSSEIASVGLEIGFFWSVFKLFD